jgi:hypothetical protein
MKKIILLILICSASATFAQTKQQSIAELIQLTKQDDLLNKSFASKTHFDPNPAATPEEQARFAEVMKSYGQAIQTLMQRFIAEDMAQVYDRHYTQAEIKDYIAFYKTASGQKLLSEAGAIQKDIGEIMATKYMPAMMGELKKISEESKLKK